MASLKKLAALMGAGVLMFALFGTALAGGTAVAATVDGHEAFSSDANSPDYWGEDCEKLDAGDGDLGSEVDTYVLTADYDKVIVKAGSGAYANTIFNDVTAGEFVFADTNGNNVSDPGGQDGDKNISHIIFCGPGETETDAPPTETPSFTDEPGGDTDAPSEPNTATIGGGTSGPADGAWLLVVALGVLLASIVVLTPARAKSRR